MIWETPADHNPDSWYTIDKEAGVEGERDRERERRQQETEEPYWNGTGISCA